MPDPAVSNLFCEWLLELMQGGIDVSFHRDPGAGTVTVRAAAEGPGGLMVERVEHSPEIEPFTANVLTAALMRIWSEIQPLRPKDSTAT